MNDHSRCSWRNCSDPIDADFLVVAEVQSALNTECRFNAVPFICLAAFFIAAPQAEAFVQTGEKIVHVADLPKDVAKRLPDEMRDDVAIGFVYGRAAILWCDLFTKDGRHVLYKRSLLRRGQRYWELSDQQWIELLGESRYSALPVPFSYRYPSSWYIFPGLTLTVLVVVGWRRVFPSEAARAKRLYFGNAQLRRALRMVKCPSGEADDPEQVRQNAIDLLMAEGGVSREEADQTLAMLERHVDPLRPGRHGIQNIIRNAWRHWDE